MNKSAGLRISYALFNTSRGWMGVAATSGGLLAVLLPKATKTKAEDELRNKIGKNFYSFLLIENKKILNKWIKKLSNYFNGKKIEFDNTLDLSLYTSFQRKVYSVARRIPYGKTVSYGWVAKKVASPRASRAVGQALNKNLLPIVIPCHRVIKSDNGLGGFASGNRWKARLLTMEMIRENI